MNARQSNSQTHADGAPPGTYLFRESGSGRGLAMSMCCSSSSAEMQHFTIIVDDNGHCSLYGKTQAFTSFDAFLAFYYSNPTRAELGAASILRAPLLCPTKMARRGGHRLTQSKSKPDTSLYIFTKVLTHYTLS